jgi:hypothetical protein
VDAALAQAAPAATAARMHDIGGHVDTLAQIKARLRSGAHAVLFIQNGALDKQICDEFISDYGPGLVVEHDRPIYFTRQAPYSKPPAESCQELSKAYDHAVWLDLDEDLDLYQLNRDDVLMVVCTDNHGHLINKGHLFFSKGDNILRKFQAFQKYYNRGWAGWEDHKWIDEPDNILDVGGWLYHRVSPPKNTPCH